MTPDVAPGALTIFFLSCAVLVCALSCLGLVLMNGVYDKLHYLAPPAVLGSAAVAAAILAQEGLGAASIKAWLVFLVMIIGNPVITFAAARAHHLRLAKREKVLAAASDEPSCEPAGGTAEDEA